MRRMSRKDYIGYINSPLRYTAAPARTPDPKGRPCRACGKVLIRRGALDALHSGGKTESKADFAKRHYCSSLCRAAERTSTALRRQAGSR